MHGVYKLLHIPIIRSKFRFNLIAGVAQLVERNLAKVEVEGSNPFSRSLLSKSFRQKPLDKLRQSSYHASGVIHLASICAD